MRRPQEKGRQGGGGIPHGGLHLRLGQEDGVDEVRPPEVCSPEVGAEQVGQAKICAPQVGPDEAGAAKVRPAQIGLLKAPAGEVSVPEVGAPEVGAPGVGAGASLRTVAQNPTDPLEQRSDLCLLPGYVERDQVVRGCSGQAADVPALPASHLSQISVRQAIACFLQVPENLVERPEHSEHLEHLLGYAGVCSPVLLTERAGGPLAGAETIEGRTAGETSMAKAVVDAAAKAGSEIGTRLTGRLVDREVCRDGKGGRHAAQGGAGITVGP
jgi:hypothetical protein